MTLKRPVVTVDAFSFDRLANGEEFAFHDAANSKQGYAARVWVENGSMYASITNAEGSAQTGRRRPVEECNHVQPPEPLPEPGATFTLKREDGGFLTVGSDGFLVQSSRGASFSEEPQSDGWTVGLACNGKFVAAETDGRLKADRDSVGDWERFIKVPNPDGRVSYRSWMGTYISAHDDGSVLADQTAIGGWELFVQGAMTSGHPPVTGPLTVDAGTWFFRDAQGQPCRWIGVTAFPLARRFADGVDIQPFLAEFPEGLIWRVFDYVTWPGSGWESCTVEEYQRFLAYMAQRGCYVELVLLTDGPGEYPSGEWESRRVGHAKTLLSGLAGTPNLLIEICNEPRTNNKNVDTQILRSACEASGLLYSSGDYEDSKYWHGDYLTAHTPRDNQWSRKAHDLLEYHRGGGPSYPTEPACKVPPIADEPMKPRDAPMHWGKNTPPAPPNAKAVDYRAYGGTCALLGAGATFHFEGGKFCDAPTDEDRQCYRAMIEGLTAFPADAPGGPYRTIDEGGETDDDSRGARTYVVGSCMCRVRPLTPESPEPGWQSLDPDGILWVR